MASRERGKLKKWNEAGGYGFIEPLEGDLPDLFFHIRDFTGKRPDVGELLQYIPKRQADGRWRAKHVRRPLSDERRQAVRDKEQLLHRLAPTTWLPPVLVLGFVGFLAWAKSQGLVPAYAYWYTAAINLWTFAAYFRDKRSAERLGQRTPELTLHMLELLGGWPAAWLAQVLLRHKSRKPSFRWTFLLASIANFALVAVWLLLGKNT